MLGRLREGHTLVLAHLGHVFVRAGEADPFVRLVGIVLMQRDGAGHGRGGTFKEVERAQGIGPLAL